MINFTCTVLSRGAVRISHLAPKNQISDLRWLELLIRRRRCSLRRRRPPPPPSRAATGDREQEPAADDRADPGLLAFDSGKKAWHLKMLAANTICHGHFLYVLILVVSCDPVESNCLTARMPGLALPNHDAANNGCGFSYTRSTEQASVQNQTQLSPDDELTAKESLALYYKPVELYNLIRQRAIKKAEVDRDLGKLLREPSDVLLLKVSKEYQAVNVSLKSDAKRGELLTIAGNDPGNRVFFYRSSRFKRYKISETPTEKIKDVHPHITVPGSPGMTMPVDQDIVELRSPRNTVPAPTQMTESRSSEDAQKGSEVDYVPKENGINVPEASIDPHRLPGRNHSEPTALQSDRARKLRLVQLKKREFFHSQKAQRNTCAYGGYLNIIFTLYFRMEMDVLYSDHDSEDELDHDIADFKIGRSEAADVSRFF
ncbi:hypothetical protein ZWY2020_059991 [Hordeum vulgare]|nr:hypothetical protein ZWY2020_059991 [Hordeum vulgare]